MSLLRELAKVLVPSLCAACAAPTGDGGLLCARCSTALGLQCPLRPPDPRGIDLLWSSAPHDGVARDLVRALKFRSLLPVATLAAERIADRAPPGLLEGELVCVPPAPARLRARGFDPAGEIAARLAVDLGRPLRSCLRRRTTRRQGASTRTERLRAPFEVEPVGPVPAAVVLIDDVTTTGATLGACAQALRRGGAREVMAATFTARE